MTIDYYLPDSRDRVDMRYDFTLESTSPDRITREDAYCHELLSRPYDGMLLSYAALKKGVYSAAARRRLYRSGVREFFRAPAWLRFMGDCGAFSYAGERIPTYSVAEVVDFYATIGVDAGISVDHIVQGFSVEAEAPTEQQQFRFELTLAYAKKFLRESKGKGFEPIAAVQGWDLASYQSGVRELQRMGYTRLALGGLVRLKNAQLYELLAAVDEVRKPSTRLHLLGIARSDEALGFAKHGVTSIDSTSPLRRAWMDARKNYWIGDVAYSALRVPPSHSPKIRKRLESGELDADRVRLLETQALDDLRSYARRSVPLALALRSLLAYQAVHSPKDVQKRAGDYERTLRARPWEACPCPVCSRLGHEIMLLRGAERNRRRGFHNVGQFYRQLTEEFKRPDAVLISCGAAKRSEPSKARDLYVGSLFKAHLKIADTYRAPLFVLSAEHGLLDANETVVPYERSLNNMSASDRGLWARKVAGQLAARLPNAQRLVVLAGKLYHAWDKHSPHIEVLDPLAGKTLGQRLQAAKHWERT